MPRSAAAQAFFGRTGAVCRGVRIGVVDASEPYWKTYAELAKKRLDVTVTYVNFNDYSQPNPALNLFVARDADKNNTAYLKLAALYQDPGVQKGVQAANGGAAVLWNVPAAELQSLLKTIEAQAQAATK
ncbi:hypothetical protein ACQP1W_28765 [Spirillospora sp. CA-255316]